MVMQCINLDCHKYKTTLSIRKNSILSEFNILFKDFIKMTWKFSQKFSIVDFKNEVNCSENTTIKYFGCLRKLDMILTTLGFVMPKYHRGRATQNEAWILGIVGTSFTPAKGYMQVVRNWSAASLLPIINSHVLPGSIVRTDE
ncbi:hypothetical protein HZS_3964 [Henneguya salminicola]|nr:hypothetical protein HZS_3964 [Henneguya salminicola]